MKQRPHRSAAHYWLALPNLLGGLSYTIQDHKGCTTYCKLGLPTPIINQDSPPQTCLQAKNLNSDIFSMKTLSSGAGETAEKLRVLAALAKALGSIHKTHSSLQTSVTPEIWHSFLVSMGTRHVCST